MNGTHIVLDKEQVVHMVSSTVGIPVNSPDGYDEYVYNDVHISDSGEYVHAAPWSVGDQGEAQRLPRLHQSVEHRLAVVLQLQPGRRRGRVVGGTRPPLAGDHGVMDWTTPWSQWTPAVVAKASI